MAEINVSVFIFMIISLVFLFVLAFCISINCVSKQKNIDILKGNTISELEQTIDELGEELGLLYDTISTLRESNLRYRREIEHIRCVALPSSPIKMVPLKVAKRITIPMGMNIDFCVNAAIHDIYNQIVDELESSGAVNITYDSMTDPMNMSKNVIVTGEFKYIREN